MHNKLKYFTGIVAIVEFDNNVKCSIKSGFPDLAKKYAQVMFPVEDIIGYI